MTQPLETVLSTIPASVDTERLIVVLVQSADNGSHMELRQQSFSKGIGWFTQSTVHLEPGQVASLRNALGSSPGTRKSPRLPRAFSTLAPTAWSTGSESPGGLRVVHADSA